MHAQVSVAAIYYTTRSNYKRSDVMGTTLRHWLPSSSWSLGSTSYATKVRVPYITHEEGRRVTRLSYLGIEPVMARPMATFPVTHLLRYTTECDVLTITPPGTLPVTSRSISSRSHTSSSQEAM